MTVRSDEEYDGFDEVDLHLEDHDFVAELHNSSMNYLYSAKNSTKKAFQGGISVSTESLNRSTNSLVGNNSYNDLSDVHSVPKSPLKKRNRHKHNNNSLKNVGLEYDKIDFADSEDDLDDSTILFDVPMSQTLIEMTKNRHSEEESKRFQSINSDTTCASDFIEKNFGSRSNSIKDDLSVELSIDDKQFNKVSYLQSFDKLNFSELIDSVVPISELKQSFLSPTRPINLPPKSQMETSKHLREFKLLKKNAIKSELENDIIKNAQRMERMKQQQQDLLIWKEHIIPNFEQFIQLPKTRELWWRGIPPELRKIIWLKQMDKIEIVDKSCKTETSNDNKTIKNDDPINTNDGTFNNNDDTINNNDDTINDNDDTINDNDDTINDNDDTINDHDDTINTNDDADSNNDDDERKDVLHKTENDNNDLEKKIENDVKNIQFAEYKSDERLKSKLITMLNKYSSIRQYDNAITDLSAVILYNIQDVDSSIKILIGILNTPILKLLYKNKSAEFSKESESFLRTFEKKLANLNYHFTKINLTGDEYLPILIKPIFTNHLNIKILSRIIDILIFEGNYFIWRSVLAFMKKINYKLYGNKEEILSILKSKVYFDVGDEDEFITDIRGILKK